MINGEIYILGIGKIKAEGRTIEEIQTDIQNKVNENFFTRKIKQDFLEGIKYTFFYDGGKIAAKTASDVSVIF